MHAFTQACTHTEITCMHLPVDVLHAKHTYMYIHTYIIHSIYTCIHTSHTYMYACLSLLISHRSSTQKYTYIHSCIGFTHYVALHTCIINAYIHHDGVSLLTSHMSNTRHRHTRNRTRMQKVHTMPEIHKRAPFFRLHTQDYTAQKCEKNTQETHFTHTHDMHKISCVVCLRAAAMSAVTGDRSTCYMSISHHPGTRD